MHNVIDYVCQSVNGACQKEYQEYFRLVSFLQEHFAKSALAITRYGYLMMRQRPTVSRLGLHYLNA